MKHLEQLSGLFSSLPLIEPIWHPYFSNAQIELACLRLDDVHPQISGNKWYKLRYYLEQAMTQPERELLSFGGAYSNHLHALAYAANLLGRPSRGIVCGHEPRHLSPTLQDCLRWGMRLSWLDRKSYREQAVASAPEGEHPCYPGAYVVPEGGEGLLGGQGVRALFAELSAQASFVYDCVVLPVGTGTTMAGAIAGLRGGSQVLGVSALKGAVDLEQRVRNGLQALRTVERQDDLPWHIEHGYHFGGFAKQAEPLRRFVAEFERQVPIMLDPVYTAKAMFAVFDLCRLGDIAPASKVLFVHTGGLQGRRGLCSRAGSP